MSRDKLQLILICTICGAWLIGVLVAIWDGSLVLKITTPLMTTILGFAFTAKATQG